MLKEQETNNAQPFFFFTTTKRDFKGEMGVRMRYKRITN